MKWRILITIVKSGRFRQYTLGKKMRWASFLLGFVVLVSGIGGWVAHARIQAVAQHMHHADVQKQEQLRRTIQRQQQMIDELNCSLQASREAFGILDDKLSNLESFVGERVDSNLSTDRRIANVTLNAVQLGVLFSFVPNGAPLPMAGITDAYGWRIHPITKRREFHRGIDLRAKHREPVWTTADGIVEFAGYSRRSGYGNLVIIDHGFGFKTYYGHLHAVKVRRGDTVVRGDIIAISGNTGRSTAPHLHYEIRFLGRPVNPYWFLKWTRAEYRTLFQRVKEVPWESLIALIGHTVTQALPPSLHPGLGPAGASSVTGTPLSPGLSRGN